MAKVKNKIPESEYKKALIYCRVSSDRQRIEGHGLDSQEQRCRVFADSNKFEVSKVFRDSYSGGGDFMNRPAMREMLEHIDKNKHINFVVIFDDLKRFARDTEFHLKLRTTFRAKDVLLKCLNYNFEDTPEGKFVETVLAGSAELEREQNKRQVIQKQKARLELGYWSFGAKKGYKSYKDLIHGTLFKPIEEEAKVLKEALEGFAVGRFQRKIDVCNFLVENGFWKKQRPEKYIDKFTEIAKDVFYAGYIEYPKWEVAFREGHHKGIISLLTCNQVKKRLEKEGLGKRIRVDISDDFPLRSLISCECCKRVLTGAWSKGRNKKYPYYFCQHKDCEQYGKSIKKDDVELDFDTFLQKQKLKDEVSKVVNVIFDKVWKEEVNIHNESVRCNNSKITALEDKIGKLIEKSLSANTVDLQSIYESQLLETKKELDLLIQANNRQIDLSVPYRTAIDKANLLLKNPYKIWEKVDTIEKQRLFYFIFEDKITYSLKNSYRTAEKPYAIRLFEEFVEQNSLQVEMAGIEPAST